MHHVTPHKVDGPVPVASWWALASCLEAITEIIPSTLILNGCYEHLHSHHSHLSLMLINYIKLLSSGLLNCITYGRLVWVLVFNWWLCANRCLKKTTSKYTKSKLFVLNQTGWTLKIWKNKRGGIWCMPKLCMCITSCRPPADMYKSNLAWMPSTAVYWQYPAQNIELTTTNKKY